MAAKHPFRVALYARVSTREQTPDPQLRELGEFCRQRTWQVVEQYVDQGISGAEVSRPALGRLLVDARRRRFDGVLVWKFDRFARSVRHLLDALETFRSLGIEFISFTEGIDTTTPAGKMIFTVLGAIAELERSFTRERVRAGIANARAQGKRIGRPSCFVLDRAPEFQRKWAGLSIRQIAGVEGVSRSTVKKYLRAIRVVEKGA